MSDVTTSRARVPMPDVWRAWGRFVRRPKLPAPGEPFGARAVGDVVWLLSLNVAFSLPLAFVLTALAKRLGIVTPEFAMLTERGVMFTLLVGALAIPVVEELVARGWLDGRRRHLIVAACAIGTVVSLAAARFAGVGPIVLGGLLLAWIVVAVVLVLRSGSDVPDWFERSFPWFFFASAALFSLAHLTNYDLSKPLMLLPFVVPQFVAALIFGFARIRYGMWANIALHAASNAMFLTLALSGI